MTKEALRAVVRHVKEHDAAPKGWEVAYIEWRHPKAKGSSGWKRGGEEDLAFLGRILRKMGGAELRAAEVERRPRGKPASAGDFSKVRARVERWHRERSKEMRAVERLKTKEARDAHRHAAERYRSLYEKAQRRLESLLFEEGLPEFELAVDYKGKRRK